MRTVDSAFTAALGLTVTAPGYLIQIDFPNAVRISTVGDVNVMGEDWTGYDVRLRGRSSGIGGNAGPTIEISNADLAWGTLALGYGVARRRVRVWALYDGKAESDFDGICSRSSVTHKTVTIETAAPGESRSSPRKFINSASGFQHLQPAGTRIPFNGETFVLERF